MRKKQKLEFKTKRSTEIAKKKKVFLIFLAVLIVFGAVSVFVLLRTVNYDLSNLFEGRQEQTTAAESTASAAPVLEGSANFLVFCVSDDAKDAGSMRFIAVISADLGNRLIRVCAFSPKNLANVDGTILTLEEHYSRNGAEQLRKAVKAFSGVTVDKYACSNDTGFKNAIKSISKSGSLPLYFEQTVNYKDDNFNVFIPAGEQAVNGDALLKYFRYSALQGPDGLHAQALTIARMLDQFITAENAANSEKLYELLFNAMSGTDIGASDFNGAKAAIDSLAASKDRLVIRADNDLSGFAG